MKAVIKKPDGSFIKADTSTDVVLISLSKEELQGIIDDWGRSRRRALIYGPPEMSEEEAKKLLDESPELFME